MARLGLARVANGAVLWVSPTKPHSIVRAVVVVFVIHVGVFGARNQTLLRAPVLVLYENVDALALLDRHGAMRIPIWPLNMHNATYTTVSMPRVFGAKVI